MNNTNITDSYGQCRCCLKYGYDNAQVTQDFIEKETDENYFNMFLDCFNLFLTTSVGPLICPTCVIRLKDANSFKALVIESERKLLTFSGRTNQETLFVKAPCHESVNNTEEVKVKLENKDADEEIILEDDYCAEVSEELETASLDDPKQSVIKNEDSFSDDDVPLAEYVDASDLERVTIVRKQIKTKPCRTKSSHCGFVKNEVQLLSRFDSGTLPALPTRESLYSICNTYATRLDFIRKKRIYAKDIVHLLNLQSAPMKKVSIVSEKQAQIHNAVTLITCSNMCAFKNGYVKTNLQCFFCRASFNNIHDLRRHQKTQHSEEFVKKLITKRVNIKGISTLSMHVDITDFKCSICNESIDNIKDLKNHLIDKHKKNIFLRFSDRIIPYKVTEKTGFECQMCKVRFETFGSIEKHMNTHFRNYICEECGEGYITPHRLKVHSRIHIEGSTACKPCKKIFNSYQKYKNHVDAVHKRVKKNKCHVCSERFSDYFHRQKHMVEVHGLDNLLYTCNVCNAKFNKRYALTVHTRRKHLDEKSFLCKFCPYKAVTNGELQMHMIKHGGERKYECSVCKKSYARKKTLTEHMRIHNNDRRFVCSFCGERFVQNCSLKSHMRTHHMCM